MKTIKLLCVFAFLLLTAAPQSLAGRIYPDDLEYKGAFRFPDEPGWEYSGYAMTYYPKGDSSGPGDGYPGSLFILGHDHHQLVAEVSIPIPVISKNKNPDELNRATRIQNFSDIRPGMFGELEIPRAGLEYMPAQGSQRSGKLYFCWGQHFQENAPTHGWCELDLSSPNAAGPWHFGGYANYATNDYLFAIPDEWADKHVEGRRLASGRFRDGLWSGRGPALFACAPWQEGNPPKKNARLSKITPLLLYGVQEPGAIEITSDETMSMKSFSEPDEWSGGSWLAVGNKSAVIFAGTKATGKSWYGYSNGVTYPTSGDENETYPKMPPWPHSDRGWWSEDIMAQIIFYDTDELAEVTKGEKKTYEPQPYAVMDINNYLYDPGFDYENAKRYLVGGISFDRESGTLYLIERRADGDRSLVHVWRVKK